jgi:hypothetical protein
VSDPSVEFEVIVDIERTITPRCMTFEKIINAGSHDDETGNPMSRKHHAEPAGVEVKVAGVHTT